MLVDGAVLVHQVGLVHLDGVAELRVECFAHGILQLDCRLVLHGVGLALASLDAVASLHGGVPLDSFGSEEHLAHVLSGEDVLADEFDLEGLLVVLLVFFSVEEDAVQAGILVVVVLLLDLPLGLDDLVGALRLLRQVLLLLLETAELGDDLVVLVLVGVILLLGLRVGVLHP